MYAQMLGPGHVAELHPPSSDGVEAGYSDEYVAEQFAYRGLYSYIENNPVNGTDPSGLQPNFGNSRACAATDCDEKDGIKTWDNPNADPSCKHRCKELIVGAHESAHRTNMGPCCDLRNKCFQVAAGLPQRYRQRYRAMCQRVWNLWRGVNRRSLELRAGAVSCAAARLLMYEVDTGLIGGLPKDCCNVLSQQLYLCYGNDPKAKIECCPFAKDGQLDNACIRTLSEVYRRQQDNSRR